MIVLLSSKIKPWPRLWRSGPKPLPRKGFSYNPFCRKVLVLSSTFYKCYMILVNYYTNHRWCNRKLGVQYMLFLCKFL